VEYFNVKFNQLGRREVSESDSGTSTPFSNYSGILSADEVLDNHELSNSKRSQLNHAYFEDQLFVRSVSSSNTTSFENCKSQPLLTVPELCRLSTSEKEQHILKLLRVSEGQRNRMLERKDVTLEDVMALQSQSLNQRSGSAKEEELRKNLLQAPSIIKGSTLQKLKSQRKTKAVNEFIRLQKGL